MNKKIFLSLLLTVHSGTFTIQPMQLRVKQRRISIPLGIVTKLQDTQHPIDAIASPLSMRAVDQHGNGIMNLLVRNAYIQQDSLYKRRMCDYIRHVIKHLDSKEDVDNAFLPNDNKEDFIVMAAYRTMYDIVHAGLEWKKTHTDNALFKDYLTAIFRCGSHAETLLWFAVHPPTISRNKPNTPAEEKEQKTQDRLARARLIVYLWKLWENYVPDHPNLSNEDIRTAYIEAQSHLDQQSSQRNANGTGANVENPLEAACVSSQPRKQNAALVPPLPRSKQHNRQEQCFYCMGTESLHHYPCTTQDCDCNGTYIACLKCVNECQTCNQIFQGRWYPFPEQSDSFFCYNCVNRCTTCQCNYHGEWCRQPEGHAYFYCYNCL